MKKILIFIFLFQFSIVKAQNLERHIWEKRIILIIAEKPSEKVTKQWRLLMENPVGLKERKLILYQVFSTYYISSENRLKQKGNSIYKDYKTKEKDFEVFLIGLDGTEKLRQSEIIPAQFLYTTIDAMPMRRNEMRKN